MEMHQNVRRKEDWAYWWLVRSSVDGLYRLKEAGGKGEALNKYICV